MRRIIACTLGTALLALAAGPVGAAPTPAQLCSSAVELAASKYAGCRLKAESVFSKTGLVDKRTADLGKCSSRFLDAYGKAQTRYGVACPMVDASADFETYLAQCSDDTTAAANGTALPSYTQSQCGNGSINAPEQCDGANLNGFTCEALGNAGGTLQCDPVTCTFDTQLCEGGGGTSG